MDLRRYVVCMDDFDCPGVLACYHNMSWAGGETVCRCNYYYGWEGEDHGCSELAAQGKFNLAFASLHVFVCSVLLLVNVKAFLEIYTVNELRRTFFSWKENSTVSASCIGY